MIVRRTVLVLAIACFVFAALFAVWPPATSHRDGRSVHCAALIWYGIPDATHSLDHPEDDSYCNAHVRWRLPVIGLLVLGAIALCVWGEPIRYESSTEAAPE